LFTLQYLVVNAAFTAFPESLVVGDSVVDDRFEAQAGIQLHYSHACSDTEDLCIRVTLPRQLEYPLFNVFGYAFFPPFGTHDQTGVGNKFASAPDFYIGKPNPVAIGGSRNYGVPLPDLFVYSLGISFRYTCSPCLGGRFHFIDNG